MKMKQFDLAINMQNHIQPVGILSLYATLSTSQELRTRHNMNLQNMML